MNKIFLIGLAIACIIISTINGAGAAPIHFGGSATGHITSVTLTEADLLTGPWLQIGDKVAIEYSVYYDEEDSSSQNGWGILRLQTLGDYTVHMQIETDAQDHILELIDDDVLNWNDWDFHDEGVIPYDLIKPDLEIIDQFNGRMDLIITQAGLVTGSFTERPVYDRPFAETIRAEFGFSISTQPVPVPATIILLGSGLAGMAGFRIRRKK